MLRITTETTREGTAFKLEGKLVGAWVTEVEHTWHAIAGDRPPAPFLVDLCGVTFIDVQPTTCGSWDLSEDERRQLASLLQRVADEQGLTQGVHPGHREIGRRDRQNPSSAPPGHESR